MPAPVTLMPETRPVVEGRFVTALLPNVVAPVKARAEKASGTPLAEVVAEADSVMLFVATAAIVVPAGMPAPVTSMSLAKPTVLGRPVISVVPLVVPVKALGLLIPAGTGPAENASRTPAVLVAVAAADSVIDVADLIA